MISKVALITGGSSGIGEGAAHKFAREGAKVILMARGQERGQAVEDAIRSDGYEATFIPCDVSDEDSVVVAVGAASITISRSGSIRYRSFRDPVTPKISPTWCFF